MKNLEIYKLLDYGPKDFVEIDDLNIAISKSKAKTADGKLLTNINWYDAKLLIQSLGPNYFLPTSSQWGKAREFLRRKHPELEQDFIYGAAEWVDSLIAFPNDEGKYSPKLQIPDIKKGKFPLLIEKSKVEKIGEDYIITEGKVVEVPNLPISPGFIHSWDDELGLPTKIDEEPSEEFEGAYFIINRNYEYYEGLRAISRGYIIRPCYENDRRFTTIANWTPYSSHSSLGFRLGIDNYRSGYVKIELEKYWELLGLVKRLEEIFLSVRF